MPESRIYHLPNSMVLFCIAINRLGLTVTLQHHCTGILVSDITESEDRR